MKLADLPTPAPVLERPVLTRNIARMAAALAPRRIRLRSHLKTAKSIDVARLALRDGSGGITVATIAEAEYFAAHGITDILYAAGITPGKLPHVARLNAAGADIAVITDDPETAGAIAAFDSPIRTLIEIDAGEGRSGAKLRGAPSWGGRRRRRGRAERCGWCGRAAVGCGAQGRHRFDGQHTEGARRSLLRRHH